MIKEAMARGEFDNLAGEGRSLDLDAYFNTPEDLRIGYSVLKSNNFVPEEVALLKEIAELKERLNDCEDDLQRSAIGKILRDKSLALSLILEKSKRRQ